MLLSNCLFMHAPQGAEVMFVEVSNDSKEMLGKVLAHATYLAGMCILKLKKIIFKNNKHHQEEEVKILDSFSWEKLKIGI